MNGPWYVEMLARNGDVLHRHQVASLPIRLGRGYDNDFIVDDDYAAAHHAVVELDDQGRLLLRDLGSQNGVVHQGKRIASMILTGDTVVRLGHTSLRIRNADFPVPAELADRTMHGWEGGLPGLAGMLLIALFSISTTFLADTQAFQATRYLQAMAYGFGAGLVWAGVWAFGNRLFGRHARLGRHLFIFGCALTAVTLFKVVSSLVAYAFSLEWITRYGSHAAIAIVCGMVFYHLCTVKPQHPRRFAASCTLLFVLGVGLNLISNEQRYGRLADDPYMALLLPPSVRVSGDHSVEDFMGGVNAMKARLDVERTKKVKDDGSEADDD